MGRHSGSRNERRSRTAIQRPPAIDPRAHEAIFQFVRVLSSCGCPPEEIGRVALSACHELSKTWKRTSDYPLPDVDSAGRMLTIWFSDPMFLDNTGSPRPLPLRGRVSLESLARRADPNAKVGAMMGYPLQSGLLRRVGNSYVPRERMLLLRGTQGLSHPQGLRGLFGLLKTLDHNRGRAKNVPVRFQMFSYNEHFPISAREEFEKDASDAFRRLFYKADGQMHRRERNRKGNEPTIVMGVGGYAFEESDPLSTKIKRRKRRRE